MTRHKQVSIYNPFYQANIDVDEDLVDLLQLIWGIGIQTAMSCQARIFDDKSIVVMIGFYQVQDAQTFTNSVLKYCPKIVDWDHETTYQRIIRHGCRQCWSFSIFPERVGELSEINFSAIVFFPVDDMIQVISSLRSVLNENE